MSKFYSFFAGMSSQKMLIVAGLLGAGFFFFFFDDGSSLEKKLAGLKVEIATEEEKVTRSKKALQEIEEVRTQVGALGEQFKVVSAKIPTEVQMAEIIRMVDGVAKSAGVSIKSKEPLVRVSKDYFEEVPLKLTLEGSFSEITMYLFYLSSLERIMRVRDFKLEMDAKGSPLKDFSGNLRFEGQVLSYRFLGEESQTGKAKR